ncbi:SET domain-containing protein 9-like [Ruditapes philippinarum]|uniref:SET domain-containing protein 9-like n=1 Tax=Ruditapes philippinarum TaxID=129788 RepID=UPI00295AFE3A|nr:SET domain-containing protein 9-like [Ruditapes philippinarum]
MIKHFARRWNQYKYRFVPWLASNINESSPRIVPSSKEDKIISDEDVEDCLLLLFTAFHKNRKEKESLESRYSECSKLMHDVCGFSIERQKSLLENGGRGVFVASGQVQCGSVVAMYPGVVYQPWEPVFWVSLANSFLFRCADGVHIDGKDTGLSKMMYNSCSKRDSVYGKLMCDTRWLTETPVNPLAVGQYVNNQSNKYAANVAYQEFDIPASFPMELRQYIPNTEARLHQDMEQTFYNRLLRVVVLVSLRDIYEGEEIFSTYYTIVQKDKTA